MSTKTRKKINLYTGISLVLSFCFIYGIPYGFADDNEFQMTMARQILTGVFETIQGTLTGSGSYASFYNYMVGSGIGFDNAFASVTTVFKLLGAMWAIAIAMSHIFTNLERGQDPQETVFKALLEISITGIIIMNIDLLMQGIVGFGSDIVSMITGLVPIGDDEKLIAMAEDLLEATTGASTGGTLWGLKAIAILILPWVGSIIAEICAKFVALQLLIELGLRKAFAPLAITDIYQEGLRSPGVRYLKRYLAVFLKMCICLVVCFLGNELMKLANPNAINDAWSGFEYAFEVIAIEFTCIGIMFKTGEYANDIVGVFP